MLQTFQLNGRNFILDKKQVLPYAAYKKYTLKIKA